MSSALISVNFQNLKYNLYEILGVDKNSSEKKIKKNYLKLAKELHPDKNPLPDAKEKFEQVKSCYDVLMDEQQRDLYNRFGDSNLKFDPRQDELKLLSGIAAVYIFWLVISTMK
jgi:DnaJ-class molecular chaperone